MKLLIIEDEFSLADAIAEVMKNENFTSTIITDGIEGEFEALTDIYDLIILDVMLPSKSGFDILKSIKNEKIHTPVIMLTAKSEIYDKLNGLENGADDYITKPFDMRELIARVKNLIKRSNKIEDTNIISFGNVLLDLGSGTIKVEDHKIIISGKELALFELLILNNKQIIDRDTIINKIWGYDADFEYNNVEVYISFLRKKLKLLGADVAIRTIRGKGYKLEVIND